MENRFKNVFILESFNEGWIIENLVRDIANQLKLCGISVRIGNASEYNAEEIVLHSRALYFKPLSAAKVNSVFITHVDNKLKEIEIKDIGKRANSLICMSPHNARILRSFGIDANKVIGIDLPHRGGNVRRPRIGIFSAFYDDGRKNENWILDYFKSIRKEERSNFIMCFIGQDWEKFCLSLASLGISYEVYRYDRSMPGEYEAQKDIISKLDYLLYPGFDGGAMSLYDGIEANINMIFSDQCYHKGIEALDFSLFQDQESFFKMMNGISDKVKSRNQILQSRSIENYCNDLISHWNSLLSDDITHSTKYSYDNLQDSEIELENYRFHYKSLGLKGIMRSFWRLFKRRL